MDLKTLFAEHPVVGQAVAGAAGGLVRWLNGRKDIGFLDGIATVLTGMLCAVYVTPVVPPILNAMLEKFLGASAKLPEDLGNGGAFLTGLLGMLIVGFFIDLFRIARREGVDNA